MVGHPTINFSVHTSNIAKIYVFKKMFSVTIMKNVFFALIDLYIEDTGYFVLNEKVWRAFTKWTSKKPSVLL